MLHRHQGRLRRRDRPARHSAAFLEALFSLQAYDALAPGEALGLLWSGVASDFSYVKITYTVEALHRLWTKYKGDVALIRQEVESGRASLKRSARVRTIALSRESSTALSHLRQTTSPEALLVFPAVNGRPERLQHLDQICQGLCQAAGIKRHNPSDLRHTAISVALAYAKEAEGISYANVSAWAGHASVSITIDNYLHMLPAGPSSITAWGQLQRAPLNGAQ